MNQKPYTLYRLKNSDQAASPPPALILTVLKAVGSQLFPTLTPVKKSLTRFHGSSKGFIDRIYIYCK